jgi:hypothetical protein
MCTAYNQPMIGSTSMRAALTTCVLAALGTGCGSEDSATARPSAGLPQGSENVKLDPADFTTRIDNPYWPMRPGTSWIYRGTGDEGPPHRIVVSVTNRTKRVAAGVVARVIHDRETQAGRLIEDTWDWYAQDSAGNVWYLGEATKEYRNGKVSSTKGSWEAGVDGAQAGVIMPAHPRVGMTYRQEYFHGEAEDRAKVLSLDEHVGVAAGSFDRVLKTRDWTPLEPSAAEHKLYARGTGPILTLEVGGPGREALVRVSRSGR